MAASLSPVSYTHLDVYKRQVYEYTYAGPGTTQHPAYDVQGIIIGNLTVTHEQYELAVKKVDATNPSKGLSGARFLIQNANGTYSKEVVTGADGTYTLSPLDANTYSITELEAPEGYQICLLYTSRCV